MIEEGSSTTGDRLSPELLERAVPWGCHVLGLYVARKIEQTFGRDRLIATDFDPLEFIFTYQQLAQRDEREPRFSTESIALVRDLQRRYLEP